MRVPQYHEHMGIQIPASVLRAGRVLRKRFPALFHDIAYLRDNGYWYSMVLAQVSMAVHGIRESDALALVRRFINPNKHYKRVKIKTNKGETETRIVKAGVRSFNGTDGF